MGACLGISMYNFVHNKVASSKFVCVRLLGTASSRIPVQQWQNEACAEVRARHGTSLCVGVAMQYDYESFLRELGRRVKKLRNERGWTHRRMIAEFGFHQNQLQRIERGEPVSVQSLLKLCGTFDLTLEELLKGLGAKDEDLVK